MIDTQDILFGVAGQTLYFDCEGRPSSVTSVDVFESTNGDDATAETATTGSASIETNPDTTLSAAAGLSQSSRKTATLTSVTGVTIGREYLITNAAGENEWFEVRQISGSDVIARHPLQNDYAIGATFEGTRISIAVDSTWNSDKNKISATIAPNPRYRVRWEYVIGGITYVQATAFDLVRYSAKYTVTASDIDGLFPGFKDSLPLDDQEDEAERIIKNAWREVKLDLYGVEKADQAIRNMEVLDMLIAYKANVIVSRSQSGGNFEASRYGVALDEYQKRFNQLVIEPKVPFAQDSGGGAKPATRSPLWKR